MEVDSRQKKGQFKNDGVYCVMVVQRVLLLKLPPGGGSVLRISKAAKTTRTAPPVKDRSWSTVAKHIVMLLVRWGTFFPAFGLEKVESCMQKS
eukprot:2518024-Amphidinium_carterae.1